MDIHYRIAGALHVIAALITIAIFGVLAVVPNLLPIPGWAASFLTVVIVLFLLFGVAQLLAAIALLRGSATGRIFVIAFSVLGLINFPFGTLLGVYSLWALLRSPSTVPANAPQ